ncbi:MAG: bifunctional (p)ppGpp synthetase/guanosine-3',5'-bis(diphosphate) 3'-pyrophosphohydrolase [Tenericutes bacterium]|nr:bifunctional (p)ppGpp synthetase/guanosine-3',5'-bis(diphosphate) 3'-pyrophosphohydrolase [Mycoplasmatota bacterium]
MEYEEITTKEELIESAKKYITDEDELNIISKAFDYSIEKNTENKRLDGSLEFLHPLNVAYILTKINIDYATISASLLHELDLNEDIEKEFGKEIYNIVSGVRKINRVNISADSLYLINYYKKILVGLCEDVRVIIIKLADRLENTRNLWMLDEETQKKEAKETLEILSPISHHLGMNFLKQELEDLSLRYYKPEIYYDIVKNLNNTKIERDNSILEMKENISNILIEHSIKHEIKGRSKSIYSIYSKLEKGKRFKDIYDILALRVYVETEADCYLTLGLIHSKYKPLSNRFKDYIAMPKENMYQSLHTTIFGVDGYLFEVQIRTYEMDKIAEYGIASHWAYKEKKDASVALKNTVEQKLQLFRSIIESSNENMSNEEFKDSVEQEVLRDEIYVYTPKGDVIELPLGSTPIDFAYRVHTDVGDKMIGALVNDNIVPLNFELKDGDIVKININKNSTGPSKEWINMVKTSQAKSRIKSFFTKINREETIKKGEELLNKELKKNKIPNTIFFNEENINNLIKTLSENSLEEIYYCIGNSKYSASYIVGLYKKETITKEEIVLNKLSQANVKKETNKNDIIVAGIDEIKVSLANCCKPIKGDEVIGYITKGKGITVHRVNCHNISNIEERLIEIEWNKESQNKFPTNIMITTEKSDNFLLDLIAKASTYSIIIQYIQTIVNIDKNIYDIIILVKDLETLKKFMNDVSQIKQVNNIERVIK